MSKLRQFSFYLWLIVSCYLTFSGCMGSGKKPKLCPSEKAKSALNVLEICNEESEGAEAADSKGGKTPKDAKPTDLSAGKTSGDVEDTLDTEGETFAERDSVDAEVSQPSDSEASETETETKVQPPEQWAEVLGNTRASEYLFEATTTPAGNLLLHGRSSSDYFLGQNKPDRNSKFLAMFDRGGKKLWSKRFQIGNTNDLAVSPQGKIYVTGTYSKGYQYDGAELKTGDERSKNAFLLKLSSTGNVEWAKKLGGPGTQEGYAVNTDGRERVTVVGESATAGWDVNNRNVAHHGTFVIRFKPNGELVWRNSFNKEREAGGGFYLQDFYALDTDKDGDIYLAGRIKMDETIEFDETMIVDSSGDADVYMLKIDASGDPLWVRVFEGSGQERFSSLSINSEGQPFLLGQFTSSALQLQGQKIENAGRNNEDYPNSDCFIAGLDSEGQLQWMESFGGKESEYANDLKIGPNGRLFMAIGFRSQPLKLGSYEFDHEGNEDLAYAMLDEEGDVLGALAIGGSKVEGNPFIEPLKNGYAFISGNFSSPTIQVEDTTLEGREESHKEVFYSLRSF